MTLEEIRTGLARQGYIADQQTCIAVYMLLKTGRPLLIGGNPGTGKTSLGKAVASMLNEQLIMVPLYDGVSADRILYDYDYQKQLLVLNGIRPVIERETGAMNMNEAIQTILGTDIYSRDFLLQRPVLQSILSPGRNVLIFDEVDKATEEIEHSLYEFLDTTSLSIPQYGTISCPEDRKPYVILTMNNNRELTEPLKRRCNFLYLEDKSVQELAAVFQAKTDASPKLCRSVAEIIVQIRNHVSLQHQPSSAEGIAWIECLQALSEDPAFYDVSQSLGAIAKSKEDLAAIKSSHITDILSLREG